MTRNRIEFVAVWQYSRLSRQGKRRAIAPGNEPVRHDGQVIGRVKSGGKGHTIGKSIAYAYLPIAKDPLSNLTGERIKA